MLNGIIVECICNIELEEPDQIIEMAIIQISYFYLGDGPQKNDIKVLSCSIFNLLDNLQFILASFYGPTINNKFAVSDILKGVALDLKYISNNPSTLIIPGEVN